MTVSANIPKELKDEIYTNILEKPKANDLPILYTFVGYYPDCSLIISEVIKDLEDNINIIKVDSGDEEKLTDIINNIQEEEAILLVLDNIGRLSNIELLDKLFEIYQKRFIRIIGTCEVYLPNYSPIFYSLMGFGMQYIATEDLITYDKKLTTKNRDIIISLAIDEISFEQACKQVENMTPEEVIYHKGKMDMEINDLNMF